jgi:hypothetical protein
VVIEHAEKRILRMKLHTGNRRTRSEGTGTCGSN